MSTLRHSATLSSCHTPVLQLESCIQPHQQSATILGKLLAGRSTFHSLLEHSINCFGKAQKKRGKSGGGKAISYAKLAVLNCIQLQARCKMCTQVSDRYLIAAALEEAVEAAEAGEAVAPNGSECRANSYLMYEPAAGDVQRKCQMRCLSIFSSRVWPAPRNPIQRWEFSAFKAKM